MAQNDIGIDLGTTTIIIAQEGKGVVLNQPSVVAIDTRKKEVLEVGDKALAMVGRTPNYISATFPLKDGVISDHTMTRELICRFVNKVYSSHMVKPRVAVCVPAAITGIESDAVVEAVVAAGARQVYLIDEPIAAALGSGLDITVPDGRMIIDIGGGTTDIAVLSLGGKVKANTVYVIGTFTVASADNDNGILAGSADVTIIRVGLSSDFETTSAATLNAEKVNGWTTIYVSAESTVSEKLIENAASTQFFVEDELWFTVYGNGSSIEAEAPGVVPTENVLLDKWTGKDVNDKTITIDFRKAE